MKVYFTPPSSKDNSHFEMFVQGLENNGAEVVNKKYKKGAFKKLVASYISWLKGARIFHLNFIEEYSSHKSMKSQLICGLIFLWLKSLHIMGGKLVWTMHNKESHHSKKQVDRQFHKSFMKKFISMMDLIVVYCSESKEILINEYQYPDCKICLVAHGCFILAEKKRPVAISHDKLQILSFGLISRYKNIAMMVRAFIESNVQNVVLTICGRCDDLNLSMELHKLVDGKPNIHFQEGFVPDEELDILFQNADIAIFPYEKDSMLNSGAVIMSFSQGKPAIVSEFGYIKDIAQKDFVFSYDYKDRSDHFKKLVDMFKRVEKEFVNDKALFERLGNEAYDFAHDCLDWNVICKKVVDYYRSVLSEK